MTDGPDSEKAIIDPELVDKELEIVKEIEKLPADIKDPRVITLIVRGMLKKQSYSGPIPPPEALKKYADQDKRYSDLIMDTFGKLADSNAYAIKGEVDNERHKTRNDGLKDLYALAVIVVAFGLAAYFFGKGNTPAGITFAGVSLAPILRALLRRKPTPEDKQ